jgi:hypothetical protein
MLQWEWCCLPVKASVSSIDHFHSVLKVIYFLPRSAQFYDFSRPQLRKLWFQPKLSTVQNRVSLTRNSKLTTHALLAARSFHIGPPVVGFEDHHFRCRRYSDGFASRLNAHYIHGNIMSIQPSESLLFQR